MTADVTTATLSRPDVEPGVRISDVIVGDRARKDYGDLTSLMESIKEHGLLQPIGVLPGNRLLFGGRRLEACRLLGHESIGFTRPTTRDDALALLRAERDENVCRKDMTPEELVDTALAIEPMERERNATARAAGAHSGADARWGGLDAFSSSEEKASKDTADRSTWTNTVVADALGLSRSSYERIKDVVLTSRDEDAPQELRAEAQSALADLNSGKATAGGAATRIHKKRKALARSPRESETPMRGVDKSRAGTAARIEKARDLADTGHSSSQIAHALGMSESSTRDMCRREGIEVPADRVVGRTRRLNATRVIEQTVRAAEPSTDLLAAINYGDLDRALLGEWISSLSESLKALRSLKTTLEKELSRDTE